MNAAKNLLEAGIINNFEAGGKLYTLKKPIILKFSPLDDDGPEWEGHILAVSEAENEGFRVYGTGFPGKQEAAEDFRTSFGEMFEDVAFTEESKLTEKAQELKRQLWGMVKTKNEE